ncbi:MAG: enoyl-CoA hydratase/isomerase family protein [Proteobacteria bacterium]|nr:enoyl-CoA hydratase/isomerase family protein [Pseudomonadota bacterium]
MSGSAENKDLLVRREDGVLVLTFNRVEARNAFTPAMIERMGEELAAAELDREIGCVVVTGAGDAFCAGGDVKAMAKMNAAGGAPDPLQRMEKQRQTQRLTALRLYQMGKPTIAALPGAAAGAGFSMALACDMRIAADTATMTTAFAKVGLTGDYGGTYLLTQLVGTAKARELYLLADKIDMKEALRLGMVNWVVPRAELEKTTMEIAKRLASGPKIAHRLIKDNLNRALTATFADCLDMESRNLAEARFSEDHKEAAAAFAEKRAPKFKGR